MANLNEQNARLASKRRQSNRRRGILAVLGCAVVVITASVLMMPAISMSKGELTCGFEEHTHGDACYSQVLVCGQQETEGHAHTDACYEKVLVCEEEDADHVHTDACYEKQLTCGQEESKGHTHSDACYEKQLTCDTPEHTHTDACYTHAQANEEKAVAKAEESSEAAEPAKGEQSAKAEESAKSSSANATSKEATDKSSSAAASAAASTSSASASSAAASNAEAKMPAVDFEKDIKRSNEPDIKVIVKAPEGAFPEGTTMEAKLIAANDVQSKVEAAIERETGEEAKVKSITAVDIVFKNKDGKEIEPAKKVEVKITSDEVRDIDNPVLVHVLDKAKDSSKGKSVDAEIVGGVKIVDDDATGAEDNTMKFESEAFSPYVIVELEDGDVDPETGARTINVSNEDAGYSITVNIPAEAGVPSDARLSVEELLQPGRAWTSHVDVLEEQMGAKISYARMFDITILDAADNEIQPAVPVEVKITLDDAADLSDNMTVAHFASEDEVEFVDANLSGDTVSFDAEGFSVYAVIEPGDGDEARVTVNFYGLDPDVPVATFYVKNSDVLKDDPDLDPEKSYSYIDDIVVDPGIGGQLPDGQAFRGWSMDDLMDSEGTRYEDNPEYAGADYTVDTTPMTIEHIRTILADTQFHEGDVINIYAMIFKYFNVTYFGDKTTVSLGTDTLFLLTSENEVSYTVSQSYAADSHQNFKGWKPTEDTSGNISPHTPLDPADIYPNGTQVTLTGNVKFNVEAPRGNWLVYSANARGATYNAPQFYLANETTEIAAHATVAEMVRTGYILEERPDGQPGWYTLKDEYIDDKGNPTAAVPRDDEGYLIISETYFEPFTFGNLLTDNVTVYAKWIPKTRAPYTIIFRTQNLDRTGYDIAGSYVGEGVVGQPIPFTFVNNMDEDYVEGVGAKGGHYTGFCLNHSGTDVLGDLQKTTGYNGDTPIKETVDVPLIRAEGDSVLTIYFDRIEYEFRFYYYRQNGNQNSFSYAQNSRDCRRDPLAEQDNVYNIATWSGFGNNNRPTQTYGEDHWANVEGYRAHYFVLNAYYGQSIAAMWPQYSQLGTVGGYEAVSFVMMNGTGLKKDADDSGLGTGTGSDTVKGTIETLDEMILGKTNDADGNFVVIRYNSRNEWRYHILYEQVDGVDYSGYAVHDVEHGGKKYYEDHVYNSRSTNDYVDKQTAPQFTGYEHVWTSDQNGHTGGTHNNNARWTTREGNTTYYHTRFYYDRLQYPITFYDGDYVSGNSEYGTRDFNRSTNPIEEINPDTGEYELKESVYVAHGASVPDDVKNYIPPIQPGQEGYIFEGWYIDEACSPGAEYTFDEAVPVGGITVYAKWRQIRYRAFLHSNAYTIDDEGNRVYDDSLNWGSPDQAMAFSIPYGGKVSTPEGTRDEYEFLGWFLDEAGTRLFTESTELNEETVPTVPVYVKEATDEHPDVDYTDYLDKHGNVDTSLGVPYNSDKDRAWVTKKLDLYGKWRKIIVGAEGITVTYVEGDLGKQGTAPVDSLLYYDQAGAIALQACEPEDDHEYQFLYWVVQKWDPEAGDGAGAYVDATDENGDPVICYPGDSFTCLLDYAKRSENHGTAEEPEYDYIMQLRAEYGLLDTEKPTHIDWYYNDSEVGTRVSPNHRDNSDGLQINEAAPILAAPEREGYKFLGWARVETGVSESVYDKDVTKTKAKVLGDEAKQYLFLTYHEDDNSFTVMKDGVQKTVTRVAADEVQPYHDMYAVWAKVYTVTVTKTVVSDWEKDKTSAEFGFTATGADPFTLKNGQDTTIEEVVEDTRFTAAEEVDSDFGVEVSGSYINDQGQTVTITNLSTESGKFMFDVKGDTKVAFVNTRPASEVGFAKTDMQGESIPSATFELYIWNGTAFEMYNNSVTTDATKRLIKGKYQLKEIAAPDGYVISSEAKDIQFTVDENGVVALDPSAPTDYVTVTGPVDGKYTVTVKNEAGKPLPNTGGTGTIPFTLGGIALVVIAACMYGFGSRRNRERGSRG